MATKGTHVPWTLLPRTYHSNLSGHCPEAQLISLTNENMNPWDRVLLLLFLKCGSSL